MSQEEASEPVSPLDQVQMALERTYLAHERTLLAWVRTGTSLVTFGFTLYKFFQYLHEQNPQRHPPDILGARTLGLLMVAIGVITLALACWQHRQSTKRLRTQYPEVSFSPAYVLAGLMTVLGVFALIAPLL
jgi:putative membrane protein